MTNSQWLRALLTPSHRQRDSWSLLLTGENLELKFAFALQLAKAYLCLAPKAADDDVSALLACNVCSNCLRMANHAHEALLVIAEEGHVLKLESIHEIQRFLQLQRISSHRFVVVKNAEKLNASSTNALLKVYEEPPPGTVFVLLAPSRSSVTATIASRSLTIALKGSDQPAHFASTATSPNGDSIDASIGEPITDDRRPQALAEARALVTTLLRSANPVGDDLWKQTLKNREAAVELIPAMVAVIRDELLLGTLFQGQAPRNNQERSQLCYNLDLILKKLAELQRDQQFHRDPLLGMEGLVASLLPLETQD